MPGQLSHSPSQILQRVLVELEVCSNPPTSISVPGNWPAFVSNEPDRPTDCVTITDTTGVFNGRTMNEGEKQGHYGVQIRLRSETFPSGWKKIHDIGIVLDGVYMMVVETESIQYRVQCINRVGDPISLGKQVPANKNEIFTLNVLIMVRMLQ